MIRWAGRMFRREWRQQLLIVALLTIAVAAAVASITIVYNTSPADNAEHGSATYLLRFDGTRPHELQAEVASVRKFFGTIDVIGHRSILVPGSDQTKAARNLSPDALNSLRSLMVKTVQSGTASEVRPALPACSATSSSTS